MNSGKLPIWRSIANELRAAIAQGQYGKGEKLPTEAALSARFGVNRHTVRHAISALVEEGLVYSKRGAGVFVQSKPVNYAFNDRPRFHQALRAAGHLPEKTILDFEMRSATKLEAERLRLKTGDLISVFHTLSFADGAPVALSESQFPEQRLPGLAELRKTNTSISQIFIQLGVRDFHRKSTRFSAQSANATQAGHLQVMAGAPLLYTSAINIDSASNLPIEYGQTWFAAERITLTLEHGE